jgi:hypothetical protein
VETNLKEKKKLIADRIKNFDYSVFGEWSKTIKIYAAVLRRAILVSSDEKFVEFTGKLKEYEVTIYKIIDGNQVDLDLNEQEKEYFKQTLSFLEQIPLERKASLKQFIGNIINVLNDEAPSQNN